MITRYLIERLQDHWPSGFILPINFQPTKTTTTVSRDPNVVQTQQEEDDIAKG